MARATLLLPTRARLGAPPGPGAGRDDASSAAMSPASRAALPTTLLRALGRGDRRRAASGTAAQLRRHFALVPDHWPVAALTRQLDADDAQGACWLRADPAWIVPDMHGARLMAHGESLQPTPEDAAALLPALRPLFGDAGFVLDAPHPARWYLRLPLRSPLPAFAEPDAALGEDLFEHLPEGEAGRRWRALANEAQVILHQSPWSARRAEQGKPPINALWFWGAGVLPDAVRSPHRQVRSHDALLRSLAAAAIAAPDAAADRAGEEAIGADRVDTIGPVGSGGPEALDLLIDLRRLRSWPTLADEALTPLLAALDRRELDALELDFEDGLLLSLRRGQRWRLWRRAWNPAVDADPSDGAQG